MIDRKGTLNLDSVLRELGDKITNDLRDKIRFFNRDVDRVRETFSSEGAASMELDRNNLILKLSEVLGGTIPIASLEIMAGCNTSRIVDYVEDEPLLRMVYEPEIREPLIQFIQINPGVDWGKVLDILRVALENGTWEWRKLSTLSRMCEVDANQLVNWIQVRRDFFEIYRSDRGTILIKGSRRLHMNGFNPLDDPEYVEDQLDFIEEEVDFIEEDDEEDDDSDSDFFVCDCEDCVAARTA